MRILITGATGFIGRHLVARLAPDHQLYALIHSLNELAVDEQAYSAYNSFTLFTPYKPITSIIQS